MNAGSVSIHLPKILSPLPILQDDAAETVTCAVQQDPEVVRRLTWSSRHTRSLSSSLRQTRRSRSRSFSGISAEDLSHQPPALLGHALAALGSAAGIFGFRRVLGGSGCGGCGSGGNSSEMLWQVVCTKPGRLAGLSRVLPEMKEAEDAQERFLRGVLNRVRRSAGGREASAERALRSARSGNFSASGSRAGQGAQVVLVEQGLGHVAMDRA